MYQPLLIIIISNTKRKTQTEIKSTLGKAASFLWQTASFCESLTYTNRDEMNAIIPTGGQDWMRGMLNNKLENREQDSRKFCAVFPISPQS